MWPSVALYELTQQNNRVASLVLSQNEDACLSEASFTFYCAEKTIWPRQLNDQLCRLANQNLF